MNSFLTLALACAVGFGAASPAAAFKLAPPSTSFSGSGPVTFITPGASYECTLSIRGVTTKKGKAKVNTAVFTPGASACANTAASGLPWTVAAINATTAKIMNLAIITPFGTCGPQNTHMSVSGSGVWNVNSPVAPACTSLTFSIPTSPPIVIVP